MNIAAFPLLRSDPGSPDQPAHARGVDRPPLTHRARRVLTGPDADPRWARPSLIALLLLTGVFYTYNLTASGWANSFYSASVQAGSQSWKAFFYGSSDAANAITVDKPPASLWIMALSARVLGLSSFSVLFPQVLMGVATTGVVYAAVKRYFGAAGGLIAAATMALTPVAVLMFRFNNPDALLVLLMTTAAYATLRATEKASPKWLVFAGALLGLGFLTKMMQVFLVLPAFALVYLLAAPTTLRKRIVHGLASVAALVVAAGWWIAIVSLVPAKDRPYIGGSQHNSILELTLGYNGVGRLNGQETGSVGGGGAGGNAMWGSTGIGRMFGSDIGGQISWLIPAALIFLVAGVALLGRRDRTNLRRASYLTWGGWLLFTGLIFSFMAGIFHQYYTVALSPAVAALVGIGAAHLWEHRDRLIGRAVLALAVVATGCWAFVLLGRTTAYPEALRVGVLTVALATAALTLVLNRIHRQAIPFVIAGALVAGLAGPTAYSVSTVTSAHTGSIVTAGPSGGMGGPGGGMGAPGGRQGAGQQGAGQQPAGPGQTNGTGQNGAPAPGGAGQPPTGTRPNGSTAGTSNTTGQARQGGAAGQTGQGGNAGGGAGGLLNATTPSTAVLNALKADSSKYTWVAAAIGSQNAAGLQLGTGLPVMSIGGFNGSDPSPTLAQFKTLVGKGRIHYFVAGGGMGGGQGGSGASSEIWTWVKANFKTVTIGSQTFYDLTQSK